MKVIFNGLSYFGSKLVNQLNAFDPENSYFFYDTYTSKVAQLKFVISSLNADLIVSFNGVGTKSKSLDYITKLKKPMLMFWHGTDVLTVKNAKKNGSYISNYVDNSKSFTDAPWLQSELAETGIKSELLNFKFLENTVDSNVKFEKVSVLSYVSEKRPEFYGLNHIVKLAKSFPDVEFNLAGISTTENALPENIRLLGWLKPEEMIRLLDVHPIFIRLTDHDGYSLSVIEAVSNGNYVLWNNPHEKVINVNNDNLEERFQFCIDQIKKNNFAKNIENIDWAKNEFDKEKVLTQFISKLKEVANRK